MDQTVMVVESAGSLVGDKMELKMIMTARLGTVSQNTVHDHNCASLIPRQWREPENEAT